MWTGIHHAAVPRSMALCCLHPCLSGAANGSARCQGPLQLGLPSELVFLTLAVTVT